MRVSTDFAMHPFSERPMALYRAKAVFIWVLALGFTVSHAFASGDWDEREPANLSSMMDQLPAKSFGEI
ncbi:MAG TPA: hypothetical protein VG733_19190, partial [Chthoniobacteraceae bacterium]|nr:hypothetical protein [Chthoniobacteraceae bacterium]